MILIKSLSAAVLLYFLFSRNVIRDYRLIIFIMSCSFVFSFLPSFTVAYIWDDLEHFHGLVVALDTHQVFQWLMTPHNEHIIPLLKLLYLFCYKYFWLDPGFFHLVILAVCVGNVLVVYRLIFVLTQSSLSAFIGASILAATNLTDGAIFICADSNIFFCAFLLLLLFYAIYQYADTQKSYWRLVAFLSILLAPATFASGLTSIIFVILFYCLCLSDHQQQKCQDLFALLLIGWLLSLAPYVYSMNAIIYAEHYHNVGETSVFGVIRFFPPVQILGNYVAVKLVPGLMANCYLSFGLFFLCFFTAIKYPKEIAWKRVLFFLSFGLLNNFIIYVFRSKWGALEFDTPRYDAFPVIMMATSYAMVLDVFVKHKSESGTKRLILIYVLCFFAVIDGNLNRYVNGNQAFNETLIAQTFYNSFRKAFVDYFHEYAPDHLQFKGRVIKASFADNPENTKYYAQFILPSSLYKKIIWSDKTDPGFLKYLKSNQYLYLTEGQ